MGGARRVKERARGYRRHVEGGHQLLESLFTCIDDAEDRGALSGQGGSDDFGRTQRAGRGRRVVVSITLIEPYLVANTDAGNDLVDRACPGVENYLDRRRGHILRRVPGISSGVKNGVAAGE